MNWSLLLAALLCLAIVAVGVALVAGGSGPVGWAMIGFFGAGVVVLGKKAIGR